MNSWFNLFTESCDMNDLSKYVEIYHVKSCSYDESFIDKNISLVDIISIINKDSIDIQNDILEIFVVIKQNNKSDLIVIYNPFELLENSYVYKTIFNINEEMKNQLLINSEQVK
ncbi:hypothetical protein [Empedobacter tilapiae]|uniref:hypothetical protein n=1 Tax=Empedobacter tilapiae TaxID=2491114 RepID=UPI0028D6DC18|nr:hypothetical protein [Empedobacter tilapiae]